MSGAPKPAHVHTLHRYFIWSTLLKSNFDEAIRGFIARGQTFSFDSDEGIVAYAYMSYWYAALYVVVEGWQRLDLHDDRVDALLSSEHIELLKLYRHGVFHFHEDYINTYLTMPFIGADQSPAWVAELSQEIGRWFIEWYDKPPGTPGG
jgi:hypothetical protein